MSAPSILLVEDEESVAACLVQALVMDGYRVVRAQSAEDGWELFEADRPQAVITDNMLLDTGMRGLDLARRLKAASPGTPVIMLTGMPPDGAREVCDVVLTKLVPFSVLVSALADVGVHPDG